MSFGDDTLDPMNTPTVFYHLWSHEHAAWWRPNGQGYTEQLSEAGSYSEGLAVEIVFDHVPPGEEVAVPVRFAEMAESGLRRYADALRKAGVV
jgi:hypothetical protein